MCRLFAMKSKTVNAVFPYLVEDHNALIHQSVANPHGWGLAFYQENKAFILKSEKTAHQCARFRSVSESLMANTVLAHIRKATVGFQKVENSHPFQFGVWTFVHNGNIKGFENIKHLILKEIDPSLKQHIKGDTDSEAVFFLILSYLHASGSLESKDVDSDLVLTSINAACAKICDIAGELCPYDQAEASENFLTFLLSDGNRIWAHQGGKHLYYRLSYQNSGELKDVTFSSEPLNAAEEWNLLGFQDIAIVDHRLGFNICKNR
ncbi:MAG: class II glutamine amidotransferase [Oligoflexales bacterium]|nr:class II glutamine amidotransferase [Oligoflexales bacterium]